MLSTSKAQEHRQNDRPSSELLSGLNGHFRSLFRIHPYVLPGNYT
jgi:hypothetical protein